MINRPKRALMAAATGIPLTLRQARALAEDMPPEWSTYRRKRFRAWLAAYERTERGRQVRRYEAGTGDMASRLSQFNEDLTALQELAEEIDADVRRGRLTADEGRDKLVEVFRTLRGLRERVEEVDRSEPQAFAAVSEDPADAQEDRHQRFPTLAQRLPAVTDEWLDGDAPADLGEVQ